MFIGVFCCVCVHLLSYLKIWDYDFSLALSVIASDTERDCWFLHLFELDQTIFTADVFTVWSVLHLQHESSVEVEGAADVTHQQRQAVDFVVPGEAGVTAESVDHAIQGQLELALGITYSRFVGYCAKGLGTLNWLNIHSAAWKQEICFFLLNLYLFIWTDK